MAAPMRYGDYVKEGWEVVKGNLVGWVIALLVGGIVQSICGLIGPIIAHNFLGMCRDAKREGKAPEIGALFKFDNAVNIWLAGVVPMAPVILMGMCVGIVPTIVAQISPGLAGIVTLALLLVLLVVNLIVPALFIWTMPLVVDKGMPWMAAMKTSMRYTKAGLVSHIIFMFVLGIVVFVGYILCGLGALVTIPVAINAIWIAYEDHAAGLAEVAAQVEAG